MRKVHARSRRPTINSWMLWPGCASGDDGMRLQSQHRVLVCHDDVPRQIHPHRSVQVDTCGGSTVGKRSLQMGGRARQLCEGCNLFVLLLQFFFVAKIDFTQYVLLFSKVCSHTSNAFMTNFAFMGDCEQAEPTLSHSLEGFARSTLNYYFS